MEMIDRNIPSYEERKQKLEIETNKYKRFA